MDNSQFKFYWPTLLCVLMAWINIDIVAYTGSEVAYSYNLLVAGICCAVGFFCLFCNRKTEKIQAQIDKLKKKEGGK